MSYNSTLGTNIRSYLLSVGAEKVSNLRHYDLSDNERIRLIAKSVKDINIVMGMDTTDIDAFHIAQSIYERNKGLSYRYFPNIIIGESKENESFTNTFKLNDFQFVSEENWKNITESFSISIYGNKEVLSKDVIEVFKFFSKRPYRRETFIKQVYETLKYLYSPRKLSVDVL